MLSVYGTYPQFDNYQVLQTTVLKIEAILKGKKIHMQVIHKSYTMQRLQKCEHKPVSYCVLITVVSDL